MDDKSRGRVGLSRLRYVRCTEPRCVENVFRTANLRATCGLAEAFGEISFSDDQSCIK